MRLMSFHPLYLLCVLSIWRKTYVFFCNDFVSPSLKHKPIACLLCTFYYSFSVILTRIQNLWRTIFQLTMLIKDYLENKPVIHIKLSDIQSLIYMFLVVIHPFYDIISSIYLLSNYVNVKTVSVSCCQMLLRVVNEWIKVLIRYTEYVQCLIF